MYKRLTEAEIEPIRKMLRRRIWRPWEALFVAALPAIIIAAFVFVRGTRRVKPLEASFESLVTIASVIFGVIFLLGYVAQIRAKRSIWNPPALLCPDCDKKVLARSDICDCGTTLEPIEFYVEVTEDAA